MAQYLECRKCRSFRWIPGCSSGGQVIRCAHVAGPGGELCPGWWPHAESSTSKPEAPAIKPLLVDEMADALHMVWNNHFTDGDTAGQYPSGCERPGYTIILTPEQCEMIEAALARYKEVGDGEDV